MIKKFLPFVLSIALLLSANVDVLAAPKQNLLEEEHLTGQENSAEKDTAEEEIFKTHVINSSPVLGSDGIEYEDVDYLSYDTVSSLPEEGARTYTKLCDEMAREFSKSNPGISNTSFFVTKEGSVGVVCDVEPADPLVIPPEENTAFEKDLIPAGDELIISADEDIASIDEDIVFADEDIISADKDITSVDEDIISTDKYITSVDEDVASADENIISDDELIIAPEEAALFGDEIVISDDDILTVKEENANIIEEVIDYYEAKEERLSTYLKNKNEYYYNQIPQAAKVLYDAILEDVVKGGTYFVTADVTGLGVSSSTKLKIFRSAVAAVILDYPYAFDFHTGSFSYSYWKDADGRENIFAGFNPSKYYSNSLELKARNKINELVRQAESYVAETEERRNNRTYYLIEFFDNWCCVNNYYDFDRGTASTGAGTLTKAYYNCHSSYGVLLNGYGVCESFALATTRFLDALGIENTYATGLARAGGGLDGHAWNHVKMPDGNWYMLDTTWNNDDGPGNSTINKPSTGKYLLSAGDGEHRPEGNRTGSVVWYDFNFAALNNESYKIGKVSDSQPLQKQGPGMPVANKPTGEYKESLDITLAAEKGCSIYYTTDGSTPSRYSSTYTSTSRISFEKEKLTRTHTLKAIAVRNADGKVSESSIFKYTILGDDDTDEPSTEESSEEPSSEEPVPVPPKPARSWFEKGAEASIKKDFLEPSKITKYTASPTGLVSITKEGVLTAKKAGRVTVTARDKNGKDLGTQEYKIIAPFFTQNYYIFRTTGNTVDLSKYIEGDNGVKATSLATSNKRVFGLKNGKLLINGEGTAKLTVKYKTYKIQATIAVSKGAFPKKSLSLKAGKSTTLKIKNYSKGITFKSTNKKVATVSGSSSLKIKALKKGTCEIVMYIGGIEINRCKITVK